MYKGRALEGMGFMEENKLIRTEDEHSKLMDLFLVKAATEWLEKQNWISSPYGGDNYLEDVIFRIKLMSGNEWNRVFSNGNIPSDPVMREYFEMLKTIDPNIKNFCDGVQKSSSDRRKTTTTENQTKSP